MRLVFSTLQTELSEAFCRNKLERIFAQIKRKRQGRNGTSIVRRYYGLDEANKTPSILMGIRLGWNYMHLKRVGLECS